MGYSITAERAEKIHNLRLEGRLCMGASRRDCIARSTRKVKTMRNELTAGKTSINEMPMCKRHADQVPPGYVGTNFAVLSVTKF